MKYRKKPIIIDAFQWTADINQKEDPEWIVEKIKTGEVYFEEVGTKKCKMKIKTLEGLIIANRKDWIIKGVKGEVYPVKNDIFLETYEPVD